LLLFNVIRQPVTAIIHSIFFEHRKSAQTYNRRNQNILRKYIQKNYSKWYKEEMINNLISKQKRTEADD